MVIKITSFVQNPLRWSNDAWVQQHENHIEALHQWLIRYVRYIRSTCRVRVVHESYSAIRINMVRLCAALLTVI